MQCVVGTVALVVGLTGNTLTGLFPPDAVVDVTKAPYHAMPDDGQDDTAAIQQAACDHIGTGRSLYFPDGRYDLSDSIRWQDHEGTWRAHLTLQGQSRDGTVLRLRDASPGFDDPDLPRGMIVTASHWEPGDRDDGGGNKAFRNHVFDLTLDTGRGNPGAAAIDWAINNIGAIKRVDLVSGDGDGVAGVLIKRGNVGPGLIKDVAIYGFDVGIDISDIQYSLTVEHVSLAGQHVAGIRTDRNVLNVRGLTSRNDVTAVQVTDPQGVLTMVDSKLIGANGEQVALDVAGTLFARGVDIQGYADRPIRANGIEAALQSNEAWAVPGMSAPRVEPGLIEVVETPTFDDPEGLSDWQVVGPRHEGEADDTAAIQRAIDSGKGTVYFRNDRVYFVSDTLVLRGKVRRLLGMGVELSLGAAKDAFSDRDHPRPLIRLDDTEAEAVFVENFLFNAQYPGEVIFEHHSAADLVVLHCAGWVGLDGSRRSYQATPKATGRVFIEDAFLPGWAFTGQDVWARQFNPENWDGRGDEPQVSNRGGRLWLLGFKTEGPAPYLATSGGGVTELLGAYHYINASKIVPTDSVPFIVDRSRAALTFVAEDFGQQTYEHYVQATHEDGSTQRWSPEDLPPRNGHSSDRSRAVPWLLIE